MKQGVSHRSEQNIDEGNHVCGLRKYMHFGITLHDVQRDVWELVLQSKYPSVPGYNEETLLRWNYVSQKTLFTLDCGFEFLDTLFFSAVLC